MDLVVELLHDDPDPELEVLDDSDPVEDGKGCDHGENVIQEYIQANMRKYEVEPTSLPHYLIK